MPYIFHRGETLSLALEAVSGETAAVSAVIAALKPLTPGRTGIDPGAPAIPMTVSANPNGWTVMLPALACAALPLGSYVADARLTVAGGVVITDPVTIRIVEAVTSSPPAGV